MVTGNNPNGVSTVIVLVCRTAISLCVLLWWNSGDVLQLGIGISALALTLLPGILIRDALLQDVAATVTALLIAAHIVFGMFGSLYETSYAYDKMMHVIGSSAIAGLLMLSVRRYCIHHSIDLPEILMGSLVVGGTLSAGALWEIFEFTIDRTGFFGAQRGLNDTMLDLIADACGGIILIVLSRTTNLLHIKNDSFFQSANNRLKILTEIEVNNE